MKSLRCVTWIARFLVRNTILKALNFSSKLTFNLSSPFEFLHFICFGFAWIIHVLMVVYLWGWGRLSTMLVHNFKDLWKSIKVVLFYAPEAIKWIELYMNNLSSTWGGGGGTNAKTKNLFIYFCSTNKSKFILDF